MMRPAQCPPQGSLLRTPSAVRPDPSGGQVGFLHTSPVNSHREYNTDKQEEAKKPGRGWGRHLERGVGAFGCQGEQTGAPHFPVCFSVEAQAGRSLSTPATPAIPLWPHVTSQVLGWGRCEAPWTRGPREALSVSVQSF